jgi:hypothetical protein
MLLDKYIPKWDFTEVHSIRIKADPATVYDAIMETTVAEISGIMRLLFFLRSLPEEAVGRKSMNMAGNEPILSQILEDGFTKLAEEKPREIVFGLIVPGTIGRVWQKSSNPEVPVSDSKEFSDFKHPGYLKVVANLLAEDTGKPGFITVRTESRIQALSKQSLKQFTPYWRIIRPFSGLIRRLWLRGIKRHAEGHLAEIPNYQQEYSK